MTVMREQAASARSVNWEHYAVLVALVAGTGLRIGEALAVRTEDFDPDRRVLHVRRSVWHDSAC
jgi:integrase